MKAIYSFLLIVICLSSRGQSVLFDYDQMGNMISKSVVGFKYSSESSDTIVHPEITIQTLEQGCLTLASNPSDGHFSIISSHAEPETFNITIYSPEGRLLQNRRLVGRTTDIDISRYGRGTYILYAKSENESISLKVVIY